MPLHARKLGKAKVRMKTKAHGDWTLGTGDQRRFQGEAIGAKSCRQLDAVAKREDGKKITGGPLELRRREILSRFRHYPGEQRPRHTMHRKPMLVEMEKWQIGRASCRERGERTCGG